MPTRRPWPWEGIAGCGHPPRCGNREIDGLGFCFRHVPDDLLDEAEEITGMRRCRHHSHCVNVAREGTVPPMCPGHGAKPGSLNSKFAAARVVEGRVTDRMIEIMGENGERLMSPPPVGNPLTELLDLAAEVKEWKQILRQIVAYLFSKDRIRSSHDKVGEQLRAEVILYERAVERLAKLYMDIGRIGIEARLAAITDRQAQVIERSLNMALQASGVDIPGQDAARKVLARELKKAG